MTNAIKWGILTTQTLAHFCFGQLSSLLNCVMAWCIEQKMINSETNDQEECDLTPCQLDPEGIELDSKSIGSLEQDLCGNLSLEGDTGGWIFQS